MKLAQTWAISHMKMKKSYSRSKNQPVLQTDPCKSFVPPHLFRWKSLQFSAPVCPEIGIRHEEKSASEMLIPRTARLNNSAFHTTTEPSAQLANC